MDVWSAIMPTQKIAFIKEWGWGLAQQCKCLTGKCEFMSSVHGTKKKRSDQSNQVSETEKSSLKLQWDSEMAFQ